MEKTITALRAVIAAADACRGLRDSREMINDLTWVAKRIINVLQDEVINGMSEPVDPLNLNDQEKDLALQGQKIPAIRSYRERTGKGLKESKEKVDDYLSKAKPGMTWDGYSKQWVVEY